MFERLTENPLSEDQRLAQEGDGQWVMTGRLHLSQGLKLWVLSQGDMLEVLAPLSLRQEIAATASRMAANVSKRLIDSRFHLCLADTEIDRL